MHNHNYNTTRPPIILKVYGRNIQNLINQIVEVKDQDKKTQYAESLIPILQNLKGHKNKKETDTTALWSDLFIMSDYKIEVTPPCEVPNSAPLPPPKKRPAIYKKTSQNKFKCCGNLLTKFIREVLNTLKPSPENQKKHITILIEMVQQYHKRKDNLLAILLHIEEIAQKKLPFPHEEILTWFPQKNHKNKQKNTRT